MKEQEQQFLNSLDKKLWNAADRLRSNIDAAEYKHVVLGLIFLKYVSDAFEERRVQLKADFQNPVDWAATSESFRGIIERDKVVVQVKNSAGNGQ